MRRRDMTRSHKKYLDEKYTKEFRKEKGLEDNMILSCDDPDNTRKAPNGALIGAVAHGKRLPNGKIEWYWEIDPDELDEEEIEETEETEIEYEQEDE